MKGTPECLHQLTIAIMCLTRHEQMASVWCFLPFSSRILAIANHVQTANCEGNPGGLSDDICLNVLFMDLGVEIDTSLTFGHDLPLLCEVSGLDSRKWICRSKRSFNDQSNYATIVILPVVICLRHTTGMTHTHKH